MSNFFLGFAEIVWFDTKFWKSTIVRVLWYPHQRTVMVKPAQNVGNCKKHLVAAAAVVGWKMVCGVIPQLKCRPDIYIYIYTFAAGVVTQVISVI